VGVIEGVSSIQMIVCPIFEDGDVLYAPDFSGILELNMIW